jgi:hypothetical protein
MQDGKHFRLARHPVMAQKLHDHLGKITPVDLLCKLRRVTLLSIPQCLHNKRTYNVNYVIICTGIIKHIHIVIKTTPEAISILVSYLCHFVCKACSVTTITVCTLMYDNNLLDYITTLFYCLIDVYVLFYIRFLYDYSKAEDISTVVS